MSTNEKICNHCGEIIDTDSDDWIERDGEFYHQDCFDENFTMCEDCQEYHSNDEIHWLDNYNRYVCDSCIDENYFRCNECNEILHSDDVYWGCDDQPYCEDCFYEYFDYCSECNDVHYRDDMCWDEDREEWLCEDCYEHAHNQTIKRYHDSTVEYLPKYLNDEDRNINYKELYGLELEITGDTDTADEFQNIMGDNVVLMHDGSVEGYEMVSMPLSKLYFYKEFVPTLEQGLKYLLNNGMSGHNGGGIHIHFRAFNRGLEVANATQILYGSEDDQHIWRMINQRRKSAMSWCSQSSLWHDPQEILEEGMLYPCGDGNHGTALNYDYRTETHELRIFNSNLRIERVIKNMECLFALQDYVRSNTELVCDTRGYIKYVAENSNKYPYLVDFMDEKNIFHKASEFYGDNYMYTLPLRVKENYIDEDNADVLLQEELEADV